MQQYADIYLLQSHSTCFGCHSTGGCGYSFYYSWWWVLWHPKHVEWLWINKYLHTVASGWIFINIIIQYHVPSLQLVLELRLVTLTPEVCWPSQHLWEAVSKLHCRKCIDESRTKVIPNSGDWGGCANGLWSEKWERIYWRQISNGKKSLYTTLH